MERHFFFASRQVLTHKNKWSAHPQVAVLKHRLRRVAVQELKAEMGSVAEVEDVLAELGSAAKPVLSRQSDRVPVDAGCVGCLELGSWIP